MRQWAKLAALLFIADVAIGAAVRLLLEAGARAAAPAREEGDLSDRAAHAIADLVLLDAELRGATEPACACTRCREHE